MNPLPVEGWVDDRILYRNLIRPVVAYVRDHGPVTVEQVQYYVTTRATGDLMLASPTYDRHDAALRVVNLMCDDIDVLDREGDKVSVSPDALAASSERFGSSYSVPSAIDSEAAREDSRRRIASNDWVSKRLFATKWSNGIRVHKEPDIDWMVRQIGQFGYVGPLIVRDAETGTIIDGGLRAIALNQLGKSWDDYSVDVAFENDRHRLAYVLAAHTLPGGKMRIPKALRDAILREVLPHGVSHREPTDAEWLDIVGSNFDHVAPVEPASEPEAEPAIEVAPVPHQRRPVKQASVPADLILAVLKAGELTEADLLSALRVQIIPSTLGRLVAAGGPVLKTTEGGATKYRLTTTGVPVTLADPPVKTTEIGAYVLILAATSAEGPMSANELERRTRTHGAKPKSHAAIELRTKPNIVWYFDGQPWRLFSEKGDGMRSWWAEKESS